MGCSSGKTISRIGSMMDKPENANPSEYGKYIGDLKDNKMDGKGTFYYNNGDKYEDDFK